MLADAVNDSFRTLFMICGFIMLFSVLIKTLTAMGVVGVIARCLEPVIRALGINPDLLVPMLSGLFEIDVGTVSASTASAPFVQKVAVASAIIGWSGLSVHAQVMSVLAGTDVRMRPYVFARLLHAVFAAAFTVVLLGPGRAAVQGLISPVFRPAARVPAGGPAASFAQAFSLGTNLFLFSLAALAVAGLAVVCLDTWRRVRVIR